jgi:hypothetical protein
MLIEVSTDEIGLHKNFKRESAANASWEISVLIQELI